MDDFLYTGYHTCEVNFSRAVSSLMNKEGQTPLDVASGCGFEHSVQYLSQFQSPNFNSGNLTVSGSCHSIIP